jgi:hypothetical protein
LGRKIALILGFPGLCANWADSVGFWQKLAENFQIRWIFGRAKIGKIRSAFRIFFIVGRGGCFYRLWFLKDILVAGRNAGGRIFIFFDGGINLISHEIRIFS